MESGLDITVFIDWQATKGVFVLTRPKERNGLGELAGILHLVLGLGWMHEFTDPFGLGLLRCCRKLVNLIVFFKTLTNHSMPTFRLQKEQCIQYVMTSQPTLHGCSCDQKKHEKTVGVNKN